METRERDCHFLENLDRVNQKRNSQNPPALPEKLFARAAATWHARMRTGCAISPTEPSATLARQLAQHVLARRPPEARGLFHSFWKAVHRVIRGAPSRLLRSMRVARGAGRSPIVRRRSRENGCLVNLLA